MKTQVVLVVLVDLFGMVFGVAAQDWAMFGRNNNRNHVVPGGNAPTHWDIMSGKNIKWSAPLGSQTHGTPVVAGGQVYVGTNNSGSYLKRFPRTIDLGCLLCFKESDGRFLWQYSAQKLKAGRIHDWPMQGIGCPPLVKKERMWFVSNRWEIVCLDTKGFRDGENDGPFRNEPVMSPREADVVWKLDLIGHLGVHPHPAGMGPDRRCSIAYFQDRIYVVTGNGVDDSHLDIPTPQAPSLICLSQHNGEVLWTDNSPGTNILHTQIASPLVAVISGNSQVIVPQGDGWVRSFDAMAGKLLWEFDLNFKASRWELGGRGRRNNILAMPVLYKNRVYISSGQEMEHMEGPGRLVCLDPTKTGDISSELAVDEHGAMLPRRRLQGMEIKAGERAIANPNSGLVWEFTAESEKFEDTMHRTIAAVAAHNGLVIAPDAAGLVHCLSAKTGEKYWTYDALAAIWSSPLIVNETVYIADEDGDFAIFRLSADPLRAMKWSRDSQVYVNGQSADLGPINEIYFDSAIHTSPIFANGTLFYATRSRLYAIEETGVRPYPNKNALQHSGPPRNRPNSSEARIPNAGFVPTPQDVVEGMLELANVTRDDLVCDLGSGDGRIPISAAKKYGAVAIGYELDRQLVEGSRKKAKEMFVAERVTFHQRDLFTADLSNVDVLTLYLFPVQNQKLIPKLARLKPGTRIVTHRYRLRGVTADKTQTIRSRKSGEHHTIYLYVTPLAEN